MRRASWHAALVPLAVTGAVASGVGWTYQLRALGWLSAGPRVPDALPLLQLAGLDSQPLARVCAAWLAAGVLAGSVVGPRRGARRLAFAGVLGALSVAVASDASFALARNLKLTAVLTSRPPRAGTWLEGVLFVLGVLAPAAIDQLGRAPARPGSSAVSAH